MIQIKNPLCHVIECGFGHSLSPVFWLYQLSKFNVFSSGSDLQREQGEKTMTKSNQPDAYAPILKAIGVNYFKLDDCLVESDLAEPFYQSAT